MVPTCYLNKETDGVCLNANQSAVLTKSTSVWFWVNYSGVRSYFSTKCPPHRLFPKRTTTLLVKPEGGIENSPPLEGCAQLPCLAGNCRAKLMHISPNKYFLISMSSSSWTQFTAPGMQCVIFGAVLYTLEKICTWGQNRTDNCFWGLHRLVHHCILTKC